MQQKSIYPWIVVGLLWFVALLNYIDRQMLSTMKPSMMVDIAELNSAENFGRLMAVFLWIYAIMSPIAGLIADRIDKKMVIIGSLFVWSAVTLLMGSATSFKQLYTLRALMGISEAFYIPAGLSLIADYHQGRSRSLAIGIHMTGIYFGQALGGFGATIAVNFSWQTTFQLFGLTGVIYSIVLILFLREHKPDFSQQNKSSERSFTFENILSGLKVLLGSTAFWIMLFYFSAPSLPGWATKNWLPTLFSNSLNIDMSQAGPLATITIALSALLGVLTGGIISDRWIQHNLRGRIYTSAAGLAMTIPAIILLGYGNGFLAIWSGALFFGFGFGMFDVNSMPILCQFVSPRHRATGYGLMNMAGISAGAIVTTFLGKSADAGNLRGDMAFLAIFVLAALLLQLTFLRPKTGNMND